MHTSQDPRCEQHQQLLAALQAENQQLRQMVQDYRQRWHPALRTTLNHSTVPQRNPDSLIQSHFREPMELVEDGMRPNEMKER